MADWGDRGPRRPREQPDVRLDLPKRRLTVFTGVSGSALARVRHDCRRVAAADQRDLQRLRRFMPTLARPTSTACEPEHNDHPRPGADGANVRSTVGTVTDANAMLRVVQAGGEAAHGGPQAYSFNVPSVGSRAIKVEQGGGDREQELQHRRRHVPAVRGHGQRERHRPDPALRRKQVARPGRNHRPGHTADGWSTRMFSESGFLDPDMIGDYSETELHDFLYKARQGQDQRHQPDL